LLLGRSHRCILFVFHSLGLPICGAPRRGELAPRSIATLRLRRHHLLRVAVSRSGARCRRGLAWSLSWGQRCTPAPHATPIPCVQYATGISAARCCGAIVIRGDALRLHKRTQRLTRQLVARLLTPPSANTTLAHTHSTGTTHTNRPTHTGLTCPRAGNALPTHTSRLAL